MEQSWINELSKQVKLYNVRKEAKSNLGVIRPKELNTKVSEFNKEWWKNNKHLASNHAKQLWINEDTRHRMIESHKKYNTFTLQHKDGREYTGIDVKLAAYELKLSYRALHKLLQGVIQTHRKWFVLFIDRKRQILSQFASI